MNNSYTCTTGATLKPLGICIWCMNHVTKAGECEESIANGVHACSRFVEDKERWSYQIINTMTQYEESLAEIERLIAIDPEQGTPEAERLKLMAMFVEKYEKEHFRMEEQNTEPGSP